MSGFLEVTDRELQTFLDTTAPDYRMEKRQLHGTDGVQIYTRTDGALIAYTNAWTGQCFVHSDFHACFPAVVKA